MASFREHSALPWAGVHEATSADLDLPERPATVTPLSDAQLVEEHFDFIWRLLRRFGLSSDDADDIAQQVFMTASQKLSEIQAGRERTYLYGVALRTSANFLRKAHRHREQGGVCLGDVQDERLTPERAAELGRARELLDEILSTLPLPLRRAFVLANIEQFELAEIAELEGIPQGTAASRLRRARAQFTERLKRLRHKSPFTGEEP